MGERVPKPLKITESLPKKSAVRPVYSSPPERERGGEERERERERERVCVCERERERERERVCERERERERAHWRSVQRTQYLI